jgi:hypothetical protein
MLKSRFAGDDFDRAEKLVILVRHYALTVSTKWVATLR